MNHLYFSRSLSNLLKGLCFLVLLLGFTIRLNAQIPKKPTPPPPLSTREISGIVKDTTDVGIPGVTIRLTSDKDTLATVTNPDGIFVFKNVKSATYTLSLSMMSYQPLIAKFKQNDAVARVVMDPITLKNQSNTLNEVVINGTPSITYKTDTVEYKASDYIVRPNATVDELLKKMEGMEVGTDGSVIHQGSTLTKAKINGKTYLGGDVATAIQNLPAEIVEKIQVVDDYGDQAARTGIKDGDPEKILNIVTRADKSVGNTLRVRGGVGNNERYEGSAFGTRLNANEVIGANLRFNNTVTGIASTGDSNGGNTGGNGGNGGGGNGGGRTGSGNGSGGNTGGNTSSGGSGGTTNSGNPSFSYRNQIGKKIKINANYGYNFTNTNSSNLSESVTYGSPNIFTSTKSSRDNNTKSHNFSFEFEDDIDSSNYLKITPTFTYASTLSSSESMISQIIKTKQDRNGFNSSTNQRPNIGGIVFYQHIFAKPRRNISLQLNYTNSNQDAETEQNTTVVDYDLNNMALPGYLLHRLVERENLTHNYRGSLTYVEPLSTNTQFEFNGQINYNGYSNSATTSNIDAAGVGVIDNSLSNIYDYSFTQSRIALNYRYGLTNTSKIKYSLGVTAVPGVLSGTKASLGTTTHRNSFNIIPIARFQYAWSRQHSIQINYSGNATEPTFDQIQPVRDVSNPQNPIVGNADLKVTFNHSINTSYNNYIANSKLNYSINGNITFVKNSISRNNVVVPDETGVGQVNETRYVNLNGVYRANGNYSISKQLNDRKYNLALRGNLSYNHGVSMSNNVEFNTDTWVFYEKFGPRITPYDWMEVNPSISYNFTKSNVTLATANNIKTKTTALNIDGKFYFLKGFELGYSASKNYVTGIGSNITSNPFVINGYLQRDFFKRKASLTLQAFDILNQNNFIDRNETATGYVDTKSNALSRYFMFRLTVNLQKWSGVKSRNGQQMQRRGDGSFNQN